MNKRDPEAEIQKISIENLQTEFYRLEFLQKKESAKISREMEVSMQAGEIVGVLYDGLYKNYAEPNDETLKSLNKLCVRLVFCMYAEDAGLFPKKDMFHDYLIDVEPKKIRRAWHEECEWWTDTVGREANRMAVVDSEGEINKDGIDTDADEIGVRPAMWVDIKAIKKLRNN